MDEVSRPRQYWAAFKMVACSGCCSSGKCGQRKNHHPCAPAAQLGGGTGDQLPFWTPWDFLARERRSIHRLRSLVPSILPNPVSRFRVVTRRPGFAPKNVVILMLDANIGLCDHNGRFRQLRR